jgi:hypothetical protein
MSHMYHVHDPLKCVIKMYSLLLHPLELGMIL